MYLGHPTLRLVPNQVSTQMPCVCLESLRFPEKGGEGGGEARLLVALSCMIAVTCVPRHLAKWFLNCMHSQKQHLLPRAVQITCANTQRCPSRLTTDKAEKEENEREKEREKDWAFCVFCTRQCRRRVTSFCGVGLCCKREAPKKLSYWSGKENCAGVLRRCEKEKEKLA